MKTRFAILAVSVSLALAGCSKKEEPVTQAAPAAQFQNHARILQVVAAGGYTYIEAMGETGERIWMAGAPIEAKAGDSISFGQYNVMQNFESKALNRKFDKIVFVESWSVGGAPAAKVAAHGTVPAGAAGAGVPPGHPPMTGGAAMPAGGQNVGVVKTTQNAGGYTYVEVQQGAGTIWVAAPETQLKVGDKVSWDGGAVMNNFTAKSLNRTFDQIVFAGGIAVVK